MGVAVSSVFVAGGLIATVSRRSSVHEPETNRRFNLSLFDFYPAFFYIFPEKVDDKREFLSSKSRQTSQTWQKNSDLA